MAYAYTSPDSKYFENDNLFTNIEKGCDYWNYNNLVSSNWWFWTIAEPQRLGVLFIALRHGKKHIPEELEYNILKRCKDRNKPEQEDAPNKADVALGDVYYALLTDDDALLAESIKSIQETILYKDSEGFQYDNSYHAHGRQLYIGGYGVNHLLVLTAVGASVSGTSFDYNEDVKLILSKYVRNTLQSCIRGQVMLFNCTGRNISRINDLKFTSRFSLIASRMKYIDTEHSEEYVLMLKRIIGEEESNQGVSISNFYYPVSDFALHVNPAYTFSIRMSSINTIKPEQVNGENLLGYYFGDGSTCITKSGFEYYNIMPLWDWNKIPGTTTPVKDSIPSNKGKVYGKAEFCGGVTDSCNGVASFSYFDDNPEVVTGASKSWFMFDDIIVCLGAGLQSEYDLQTTVEQCWGKDSFIIVSSKGNTYFGGNVSQENINAIGVLHDGIGYFFPESDFLSVSNMQKDGNWRIISNEQPDSILEGKVFTLCVNHKKKKTLKSELKYAYAIIPSSGTEYFEKFCNNPSFDIIVNSDSLQVVRNYSGDYGVVFFKKCNYTVGNYHFSSTRPCIYLLKTDLGGGIFV